MSILTTGFDLKDLVKILGLPKNTVGFTLRAWANEIVTVEAEYYPEFPEKGKELITELQKYELHKIKTPLCDPIWRSAYLDSFHGTRVWFKPYNFPEYW